MNTPIRHRIINWVSRNIDKTPEGCKIRGLAKALAWVLCPVRMLIWAASDHIDGYDPIMDCFIVNGYKISRHTLIAFTEMKNGDWIEIVANDSEHKQITLRRISTIEDRHNLHIPEERILDS